MLTTQVWVILNHDGVNLIFNFVDVEYTGLSKSLIVDAQNFQVDQQTSLLCFVLTS